MAEGLMQLFGLWLSAAVVCCGQEVSSDWHGWIEVPNDAPLRLALHVRGNGPIGSSIDSMDEGVANLGIDSLSVSGSQLRYEIQSIAGSYTGTVTPDGQRVVGSWFQDGGIFPLVWLRGPDPASLTQPLDVSEVIKSGRIATDELYRGEIAHLWTRLGPVLCQSFGNHAVLVRFRDELLRQWGTEKILIAEDVETRGRLQIYRRQAAFAQGNAEIQLIFNPAGRVVGMNWCAAQEAAAGSVMPSADCAAIR